MTPGSKLLQGMADKLNREISVIKDWRHLAFELEVPVDIRQAKSPTKEVMKWLVSRRPDMTLKDVVKALDKIQRDDAIQIITRQFPDTVGESKVCFVLILYVFTILYIASITRTVGENFIVRCTCMEEMFTLYFVRVYFVCVMRLCVMRDLGIL